MPSAFSRRQFVATAAAVGLISRPVAGSSNPCAGQDGEDGVVWQRTYGEDGSVKVIDAVAHGDGYALAGIDRNAETDGRSWLRRVDGDGEELWRREYGDDERRSVRSVAVTADDGFVLAGSVGDDHGAQFVTKTDADGDEEWTTTVDVSGYGTVAVERNDGSVVLGVTTAFPEPKYPHVSVIDDGGEVSRSRTFDEHGGRRIRSGLVADDTVVLAGTDDSDGADGWLWRVALDEGVEIERSTVFEERVGAIDRFEGGDLVLAANNGSWIARIDPEWQVEWELTEFDPSPNIEDVSTVPGGVAACGYHWGSGCARPPWAFRADGEGTSAWSLATDISRRVKWGSVLPASDDGRVVVAGTDYDGEGSDALLSLVEAPESDGEETTTTEPDETTIDETTTLDETTTTAERTTTNEASVETTASGDDTGTTADESTADGLDGFGLGAGVAALTAALGHRVRRNGKDD